MVLLLFSLMPLADEPSRVAGGLHHVGDGALAGRESDAVVALGDVEFETEPFLVAAGVEAGARRAAHGGGDVAVGEPHAIAGESVDVGRLDHCSAVGSNVAVAKIVG